MYFQKKNSKRDEELVIGFESTIEENGYDYLEVATWCRDNGLLCSSYREIYVLPVDHCKPGYIPDPVASLTECLSSFY